ncbi:NADPH-dependent F420 reductase [Conyzicola nivalis]|uniref:NADPH-dependent F420 reductase n=1 Tax=Conyzicola nivalis TaxID=1477021 RepID=UPI003395E7DB
MGAGNVGRLYGEEWVKRGHEVAFSYVRDVGRLESFVGLLGARAYVLEVEDVAAFSDVVIFAPPFEQIEHAAALLGPVSGKVVVDTTNPFNPERTGLVDLGTSTASEKVAELFRDALVVKALHNVSVEQAASAMRETPVVVFIAGDDNRAKDTVAGLIADAGLVPFDTGDLSTAVLSEAPGPLFMNEYNESAVAAAVATARG